MNCNNRDAIPSTHIHFNDIFVCKQAVWPVADKLLLTYLLCSHLLPYGLYYKRGIEMTDIMFYRKISIYFRDTLITVHVTATCPYWRLIKNDIIYCNGRKQ